MFRTTEAALSELALSNIDQLLNCFDPCGQIEIALPLLRRHRDTLAQLHEALHHAPSRVTPTCDDERWVDDIVTIYSQLGGRATHLRLYRKIKELRTAAGRSWPDHAEEAIRQTLQAHCAESSQYRPPSQGSFRYLRPNSPHVMASDLFALRSFSLGARFAIQTS
jgi:hypothetical protein